MNKIEVNTYRTMALGKIVESKSQIPYEISEQSVMLNLADANADIFISKSGNLSQVPNISGKKQHYIKFW